MNFLLFGSIAYLLGSIPSAVWIGKSWYGIDVREHGSKNAGATNTFRVLGKRAGIIVLLIDIIKGFLAVLLPGILLQSDAFGVNSVSEDTLIPLKIIVAILAVLGHVFPVFANFNGGKGVATSLGVIIGIHPPAAGICVLIFLIVFIISINKTVIPARLPSTLNVFVAPAFLLPCSRTSIPYHDFPIQTADGIEPNK
jgi:glycerol-3-phosphate acyltransferase PlsY